MNVNATVFRYYINVFFVCVFSSRGHSGSKTKAFREEYSKLAELRAFVPTRVPLVALTATATAKVKKFVIDNLNMVNYHQISETPNRPNIKLNVVHVPQHKPFNDPESLEWLFKRLNNMQTTMPRIIIYCRTHVQCHSLFAIFDQQVDNSELYAMYHGSTVPSVQEKVARDFEDPNGKIRLLFATIAFGMGVDVKGVHTIFHMGVPQDIDDYVQESGRAGRDGKPSFSVIITYPAMYAGTKTETRMKDFVKNQSECRRKLVLREFNADEETMSHQELSHQCCDRCASRCQCGSDSHYIEGEVDIMPNFVSTRNEENFFNRRQVSADTR